MRYFIQLFRNDEVNKTILINFNASESNFSSPLNKIDVGLTNLFIYFQKIKGKQILKNNTTKLHDWT